MARNGCSRLHPVLEIAQHAHSCRARELVRRRSRSRRSVGPPESRLGSGDRGHAPAGAAALPPHGPGRHRLRDGRRARRRRRHARGHDLPARRADRWPARRRGVRRDARRGPRATRLHDQRDRLRPDTRELRDPFRWPRGSRAAARARRGRSRRERMREDRLRALRAIRFAARFGFAIEPSDVARDSRIRRRTSGGCRWSACSRRSRRRWSRWSGRATRSASGATAERSRCSLRRSPSLSDVALATLDLLPRARECGAVGNARRTGSRRSCSSFPRPTRANVLRELRFSNERVRWIGDLVERWHARGARDSRRARVRAAAPSDATVRRWVAAIGRTRVSAFFAWPPRDSRPSRRARASASRSRRRCARSTSACCARPFAIRSKSAILRLTAAIS